ncbi:MAG TPA: hypothetical protein VF498_04385 [Anaerolineales bacterium]
MSTINRTLFFILLPIIGFLLWPPEYLRPGLPVVLVALLFFVALGWVVMRGRSPALTLLIFLLGLNVIIRLMMLPSHVLLLTGGLDIPYVLTAVIAIVLSLYLVIRLDKSDVRVQMVT